MPREPSRKRNQRIPRSNRDTFMTAANDPTLDPVGQVTVDRLAGGISFVPLSRTTTFSVRHARATTSYNPQSHTTTLGSVDIDDDSPMGDVTLDHSEPTQAAAAPSPRNRNRNRNSNSHLDAGQRQKRTRPSPYSGFRLNGSRKPPHVSDVFSSAGVDPFPSELTLLAESTPVETTKIILDSNSSQADKDLFTNAFFPSFFGGPGPGGSGIKLNIIGPITFESRRVRGNEAPQGSTSSSQWV